MKKWRAGSSGMVKRRSKKTKSKNLLRIKHCAGSYFIRFFLRGFSFRK